ncbi:hypothetical protein A2U01_0051409, partial [Trifolium medium]|nr:hypothetical protein [Trifolium medium]
MRTISVCKKPNAHCCKVGVRAKDLEGAPLVLNQEWEEISPEREGRLEREWMENTPLWETDPYEHTRPDEPMEFRESTTLTNEERIQLLREEAVEEWLEEMKTKWKTLHLELTPFIPRPKTEEHKEWVKRWKRCYK